MAQLKGTGTQPVQHSQSLCAYNTHEAENWAQIVTLGIPTSRRRARSLCLQLGGKWTLRSKLSTSTLIRDDIGSNWRANFCDWQWDKWNRLVSYVCIFRHADVLQKWFSALCACVWNQLEKFLPPSTAPGKRSPICKCDVSIENAAHLIALVAICIFQLGCKFGASLGPPWFVKD